METKHTPTTHDYQRRYWGHDYNFTPIDKGMKGRATGWGAGIKKGDFLILQQEPHGTRYKVDAIKYFSDPSDMWSADLSFAPRQGPVSLATGKEDE